MFVLVRAVAYAERKVRMRNEELRSKRAEGIEEPDVDPHS
jgi:hypothetical protein